MSQIILLNASLNSVIRSEIYYMKTLYFLTNHFIKLFFTCVFGLQPKEMHLQSIPVNEKLQGKRNLATVKSRIVKSMVRII